MPHTMQVGQAGCQSSHSKSMPMRFWAMSVSRASFPRQIVPGQSCNIIQTSEGVIPARSTRESLPRVTDPSGSCLCTVRVMRQLERLLAALMLVGAVVRLASACCVSSTSSLSSVTATCKMTHLYLHALLKGVTLRYSAAFCACGHSEQNM